MARKPQAHAYPSLGTHLVRILACFFVAATILHVPGHIRAESSTNFLLSPSLQSGIYAKDRISLQLVSGGLFSPSFVGPRDTPQFDYAPSNIRLGWMLTKVPEPPSLFRGNLELVFEISNAAVLEGPGSYMGGVTALIRYNFLPPHSKLVPYVQAGAGIVYTDAYRDRSQRAIGQAIEFTPQASLGLRYLINKNWSIDAEAMFHHISNAGLSDRNVGVNAFGAFLGVTYYFDSLFSRGGVRASEGTADPEPTHWPAADPEIPLLCAAGVNPMTSPAPHPKRIPPRQMAPDRLMVSTKKPDVSPPVQPGSREVKPSPGIPQTNGLLARHGATAGMRLSGLKSGSSRGQFSLVAMADVPVQAYKSFFLDNPSRLVVDLPGKWQSPPCSILKVNGGMVKRVRVGMHSDKLRLVLDLKDTCQVSAHIRKSESGLNITLKRPTLVTIAPLRLVARDS